MMKIFSCAAALSAAISASAALPSAASAAPAKFQKLQPIFKSYQAELDCLARAVYFEARSESLAGQHAVARVILNRVDSEYYPHTICEVVYQNQHMRNACQFSFACDGTNLTIREPEAFETALQVARSNFHCDSDCRSWKGDVARSTHYHADYVNPIWAAKLEATGKVGRHLFYYTATR
jgi:spore germination cell wall hydrolase CwlJ-like protein